MLPVKKNKKRASRSEVCISWQRPKAGISCDKLRRNISGLFFPSFESKDRRGFIFVFSSRRALVLWCTLPDQVCYPIAAVKSPKRTTSNLAHIVKG